MRIAENGSVDRLFPELFFHVCIIHSPYAVFVLYQRRMYGLVAVVFQACGEAYVCRAVDKDVITAGADAVQCTDNSAQNAIFVANVPGLQTGDTVAGFMPADDGLIIFRRGFKVTEGRVTGPFNDRLLYGRYSRKVHICYPHRDGIEALFRRGRRETIALQAVYCNGISAMPVNDGSEVVFHMMLLLKKFCLLHLIIFLGAGQFLSFQYDVTARICYCSLRSQQHASRCTEFMLIA